MLPSIQTLALRCTPSVIKNTLDSTPHPSVVTAFKNAGAALILCSCSIHVVPLLTRPLPQTAAAALRSSPTFNGSRRLAVRHSPCWRYHAQMQLRICSPPCVHVALFWPDHQLSLCRRAHHHQMSAQLPRSALMDGAEPPFVRSPISRHC